MLGDVLGGPTILPIPRFGPKLLLGSELAEQLLYASSRVLPRVLTEAGFTFSHAILEAALRAEDHGVRCPHCQAWWQEHADASAALDEVVGEVFASFEPPVAAGLRPWLAVAATVLILLAGGLILRIGHHLANPHDSESAAASRSQAATQPDLDQDLIGEAIFVNDLENGEFSEWTVVTGPEVRPAVDDADRGTIFSDDLESGTLSSWSS